MRVELDTLLGMLEELLRGVSIDRARCVVVPRVTLGMFFEIVSEVCYGKPAEMERQIYLVFGDNSRSIDEDEPQIFFYGAYGIVPRLFISRLIGLYYWGYPAEERVRRAVAEATIKLTYSLLEGAGRVGDLEAVVDALEVSS